MAQPRLWPAHLRDARARGACSPPLWLAQRLRQSWKVLELVVETKGTHARFNAGDERRRLPRNPYPGAGMRQRAPGPCKVPYLIQPQACDLSHACMTPTPAVTQIAYAMLRAPPAADAVGAAACAASWG